MIRIAIPTFLFCSLAHTFAKGQLNNSGFESVNPTTTDTLPNNWQFTSLFGGGLSSNAHSGSYALSVWNWYYYAEGYASNGENSLITLVPGAPNTDLGTGEPIAFRPVSLSGFYLYDTTGNGGAIDSSLIQITLSKFNSSTNTRDVIGFGETRLPVSNNYKPFTVLVNYTSSIMPDTVMVALQSSLSGFCSTVGSGTCLYFTVDDLLLETAGGMVDIADKSLAKVYPNPANGMFTIETNSPTGGLEACVITTLTGKEVLVQALQGYKATFNSVNLLPGFYMYQLRDVNGLTKVTGKILVVH